MKCTLAAVLACVQLMSFLGGCGEKPKPQPPAPAAPTESVTETVPEGVPEGVPEVPPEPVKTVVIWPSSGFRV